MLRSIAGLLYKEAVEYDDLLIGRNMSPFYRKLFFWVLLLVWLGGCHLPWREEMAVAPEISPEARTLYQQALATYHSGDYTRAVEQFESLRAKSSGGLLARMALYGQACAQLMSAQNPQEYQIAVNMWNTWLSIAPKEWEHEYPTMMTPLVGEKMIFSNLPSAKDDAVTLQAEKELTRWALIKTRAELDVLKQKLVQAEKTLKQNENEIEALEKENIRLNEQIRALETIDQKMQEKKSAIPSTN